MKKQVFHLSALALLCAISSVSAQEKKETEKKQEVEVLEEVVITDSRFEIKKENSGKVVHQITVEQIEQNQGKSIVDLLNSVAGIEIGGSRGNAGQNLGYYIRGGRSNEVAILIDGMQVVDPLQNNYDLRLLNVDMVESIEIIKGAASTLYGSGAATAVINIQLKRPSKEKVHTVINTTLGTRKTQNISNSGFISTSNANLSGSLNKFDYSLVIGNQESKGVSAAKPATSDMSEFKEDPFSRLNLGLNMNYKVFESFNLSAFSNYNTFTYNYDGGSFIDASNEAVNENYRIGLSPTYTYEKGIIQINASYNQYNSNGEKTTSPTKNEGKSRVIDAFVKHKFSPELFAILGYNYQNNTIETYSTPWGSSMLQKNIYTEEAKTTISDPYVNIVYISSYGLNINTGGRLNSHNKYGNHFVYNINPSFTFKHKETNYSKIFTSYSTAFVAPSLQDLYASWGNVDLEPQESLTYEAGIESKINEFLFNFTYFKREVENIIGYSTTLSKIINQGKAKINGVEIGVKYNFQNNFSFDANYTYTDHNNNAIRIPKNKVNANFTYRLKEKTNFLVSYRFNDSRGDTYFKPDFSTENVTLNAFSIIDFSSNHQLNENLKLFASVTNIFDTEFEEIIGFTTLGRNYNLGLRLNF